MWDLSDPNGTGFLDQQGFFTALKLVALAQNNQPVAVGNINSPCPLPDLGDMTAKHAAAVAAAAAPEPEPAENDVDDEAWTISTSDKDRFDAVFRTLEPEADGTISGKKARQVRK